MAKAGAEVNFHEFREQEMILAIAHLTTGKAPGPDGWPAEFYKRLSPRERDEQGQEEPSRMARLIA